VPNSAINESVLRACSILRCFRTDDEHLRLRDIVERTSLRKTTAHRLLSTLVAGGVLERISSNQFRRVLSNESRRGLRVGFAAQTTSTTFSRLVTEGIHRVAEARNVELIIMDNRYSPRVALHNADMLIRRRVDVVLEFQTFDSVAPVVASRFLQAGIPVIAVEVPHPGAIYFGADHYRAGYIGGKALGRWVKSEWGGKADELILLREQAAGPLPNSRITGMLAGFREVCPQLDQWEIRDIDGRGRFKPSYDALRGYIRESPARRTLIAAHNDPGALAAIKVFEELGRAEQVAIISQNCVPEAQAELRRAGTRLVGSVAYYPEKYGDQLIPLAISIVRGAVVPPATFVRHELVTPENVNRFYGQTQAFAAAHNVSSRLPNASSPTFQPGGTSVVDP
jgi:ribose transport system substrate-binding protein